MKIKFLGAVGTVTGSKYLLSTQDHNYLIDCGLFQGLKDLRLRNWQSLDIAAADISAVIITHAHIDHTGYLPRLVNLGFKGPIYSSYGTFDLAKILLPDSGYLQEEEAYYANKKGYSHHKPALPLYTREEAEASLNYFQPLNFHSQKTLNNDARFTFLRAGHILGASCIVFEAEGRRIIFSGDVGRYDDIIMYPPEPLPDADYVVIESTYGDREHDKEDIMLRLSKIINDTVNKGGTIVIPSFAVGRAQHILHILQLLKEQKRIPELKTYLDSPMSIDATELYCRYNKEHRLSRQDCAAMYSGAILTHSAEESKAINAVPGPKIIVSASGMLSGGRIVHHLAQYIADEKNAIILVGFQAAGTRGRDLVERISQIKMFGEEYRVLARIENISGLSAHADYNDLLRWLSESKLKKPELFVTHGEPKAAESFAERLRESFKWQVKIPKEGDEYEL
jgi:metallo-beta-lactamase family protein